MAGAQQLPPYPDFSIVEEATIVTRWADWLDGLQAMIRAMKVDDDGTKEPCCYTMLEQMLENFLKSWMMLVMKQIIKSQLKL
jgi:hypothetical protein